MLWKEDRGMQCLHRAAIKVADMQELRHSPAQSVVEAYHSFSVQLVAHLVAPHIDDGTVWRR
jgi:hypothetical protein